MLRNHNRLARAAAAPVRDGTRLGATAQGSNRLLLILVGANIALQLISASLIKFAASLDKAHLMIILAVLAGVVLLSLGRFAAWNAMHRRYPVSVAYPASALFFPCVVALAYALGEPVSGPQALGAGLVTLGVLILLRKGASQDDVTA